jgi:Cu/Zn superoxide dismutase
METQKDNNDYTRRNRFTGESIELTKEEAEKHDAIFVHEALATLDDKTAGEGGSKHWDIVRKNLNWFRRKNAKAYMVLLD